MKETQANIPTVTELTRKIKNLLEYQFSHVQVRGEITQLTRQSSGHLYFTLKDSQSQLSAVLFKGNAAKLSRMPKTGDQVTLTGSLSLYAPRGSYQIIVREITFTGLGDLLLRLHQLKDELQKLGYFDPARKKPIPKYPRRIGVVTSPTGAVIQDILNVLGRRMEKFHLTLNPVRVQGEEAAREIAQAIDQMNQFKLADVLIVGRGGGSLEDLFPFNEKIVADAIARSEIPIISAVGHETDFTICDYVADLRAPTPSAAAEIISKEKAELISNLQKARQIISGHLRQKIDYHHSRLQRFSTHPFFTSPQAIISPYHLKLDDLTGQLDILATTKLQKARHNLLACRKQLSGLNPLSRIQMMRAQIRQLTSGIDKAMQKQIEVKSINLSGLKNHLTALNPKNILTKGFCIPFDANSKTLLKSTQAMQQGQSLQLIFADGSVDSTVEQVHQAKGKAYHD
ncbi:MAG: Exodeoxyribonuclease 7 large subunit [Chlamydiia bacterium]|nr:Exodeoxyribonuclease 7 large subunit [Chlamydiia bacterium]